MGYFQNLHCALIAVTEDHKLAFHWDRALHDVSEIFPANSMQSLREHLEDYKPSLVLLDESIPGFILQDIPGFLEISPYTKIILFASTFNEEDAIAAIKAGAKGYAQKNSDVFLLRKAIEVIRKGELWIPRHLVTRFFNEMQDILKREKDEAKVFPKSHSMTPHYPEQLNQLTKREQQIAELIGNGYSNKEIGNLLKISESTVKAHLSAIYHKLGLVDRLSLALFITHPSRAVQEPAKVE